MKLRMAMSSVSLLFLGSMMAALEPASTAVVRREAPATARWDFNADGAKDLAIGVPEEAVGTSTFSGAVHVLYGSTQKQRLVSSGSQLLTKNSSPSIRSGSAGRA